MPKTVSIWLWMLVIDGSKMRTFGPKSGAVPAGAPAGGHVQGPPLGASGPAEPESGFAGAPEEEFPPPPTPLELLVPLLEELPPEEVLEVEPEPPPDPLDPPPEPEPEPPSGTMFQVLSGVEEQAAAAAAAALSVNSTARLAGTCAYLEYFSPRGFSPAVMPGCPSKTPAARLARDNRESSWGVDANGRNDCAPAVSGLRKSWLYGPVCEAGVGSPGAASHRE
jgi:hypothetical protein